MSLSALLSHWRAEPTIAGNITEWRTLPMRPARFGTFPTDLHPALVRAVQAGGIQALYTHQIAVFKSARDGGNPVIVTGTASGKTLAYQLPVVDRLLRDMEARALFLFPTKSLAQDQLAALRQLCHSVRENANAHAVENLTVAIYDGDTPSQHRPEVRAKARLLLSNPDMLHAGILPHHTLWAHFFRHLQFIVIDEMHTYRGVFGSHVTNLIRRLKRIARFYGAQPQFILTSATIGNPAELAERLIEAPVDILREDGSARGPQHFLVYNPPIVDRELGLRRSSLLESVRLAEDLLTYTIQTIIFSRTRRSVEIILTYLRQSNAPTGHSAPADSSSSVSTPSDTVRGYRSGYLPKERRAIEHGLRQGDVRVVVATNALELGIDIGGMGAAILAGYPGTIAGTWQQAGRAGRGSDPSLAVLVTTANPLDQFLAHHPDYFFDRSPEHALINPDNPLILLGHLRCAAFELPFKIGETFGRLPAEQLQEFLNFLSESGILYRSGPKYFWMADKYPAEGVSLRSASTARVLLHADQGERRNIIGEVDLESAHWMVHPQAVYLHEARTYLVEELDLEQHVALLRQQDIDYYTEPLSETTVELIASLAQAEVPGAVKAHGEILVTTQVKGFRKIKWFTHETLGQGELSLPPFELRTTGYWLALAPSTVNHLREEGRWSNDPNRYGPGWNLLRERVRARDGYRCQVCGAPENGRSHDVHHKIPFRVFGNPEQANRLENLITLCHTCHRRVETAVRVRSGLAGLAYALGNLAPLFLMCDARDIGVHHDPQLPLSDGEPGVVLYDMVPAGIGLAERLFELHGELMERALELVESCPCADGCPSCVGPGGENGLGGKQESVAILQAII